MIPNSSSSCNDSYKIFKLEQRVKEMEEKMMILENMISVLRKGEEKIG